MPRVLLTRPQKDSELLAEEVAELGYGGVIEPLLILKPTFELPPDLTDIQAIMLTSAHALSFLDRASYSVAGLLHYPCFCVGSSTAAAATKFGFQSVHDAEGDGLALAARIKASLFPAKGKILHIAAHALDRSSRDEIVKSGFNILNWTTYTADTATTLSPMVLRMFREGTLDAILLFSTRTAETLKRLIVQHGLETCCKSVIALGISDSVAEAAGDFPWRRRIAASLPTEDAVLQRLQDIMSEVS